MIGPAFCRSALGFAGIVAVAVASATVAAAPSTSDPCHRALAHGTTILARSKRAAVFLRKDTLYGCAFAPGTVHRLNPCCDDLEVKVAGVYAGYVGAGTAIGDETSKIGVYDLRTGVLRKVRKLEPNREGGGREIDTASFVTAFKVAGDGGVAWIAQVRHDDGTLGPDRQVRVVSGGRGPWERIVDQGTLSPATLTVGDGRVSWSNQGTRRSDTLSRRYLGHCASAKGTQVRRTDALLVVKRPFHRRGGGIESVGSQLFGCSLPNGLVYQLGVSITEFLYDGGRRVGVYGSEKTTLSTPAGPFILRRTVSGSNSFTVDDGEIVDLRSGVATLYYAYEDFGDGPDNTGALPINSPSSLALSSRGVFAGVYAPDEYSADPVTRVIAVAPNGAMQTLDSAPGDAIDPASLAVVERTVSWTHSGEARATTV